MDKIIIRDLIARGVLGVNDWEREKPQEILINIELYVDLRGVGESDNLHDSVSYSTIAKRVQAHAEAAGRLTAEALASDLAHICLEDPKVSRVLVRVEKPGAVRFTRTVGVEIERTRGDYI